MAITMQMKCIVVVLVFTFVPVVVCANDADFNIRGHYFVSTTGDNIVSGLHTIPYEGSLTVYNRAGILPLSNITITLLADNITKVDDSQYAQWTRSSAQWVYPPNFTVPGSYGIDWKTDISSTVDLPVTFSRNLNQTTFAQDGYQLVTCQVTFWNLTGLYAVWGEVDNYQRDKVNVTILKDTFSTDLPKGSSFWVNDKQYQFLINKSEVILGHAYTYSIVLKVDRINATKTVEYKPKCGINLITNISMDLTGGSPALTYTIPASELPPHVHQATVSTNTSVSWGYWSNYQRSAILSEKSNFSGGTSSQIGIFRPLSGYWYFDNNLDGVVDKSFRYGGAGDRIIKGDWQGTGKDGIAIFRSASGYWYFDNNLDGIVDKSFRFGGSDDQIIVGKWNGSAQDGIAIFRPASGFWYFDNNLDGIVDKSFRFGGVGDRIIKGDWQGTGKDGIAIFRPSSGYWYFDYNLDGIVDKSFRFGGSDDQIIVGKWQGTQDGIAIFRPASGFWCFDNNLDGIVDKSFRFGGSTDKIIAGDWQGTGSDGIAIFRPASGYWYFDYNLDGIVDKSFRYGGSADQIIAGKWT